MSGDWLNHRSCKGHKVRPTILAKYVDSLRINLFFVVVADSANRVRRHTPSFSFWLQKSLHLFSAATLIQTVCSTRTRVTHSSFFSAALTHFLHSHTVTLHQSLPLQLQWYIPCFPCCRYLLIHPIFFCLAALKHSIVPSTVTLHIFLDSSLWWVLLTKNEGPLCRKSSAVKGSLY